MSDEKLSDNYRFGGVGEIEARSDGILESLGETLSRNEEGPIDQLRRWWKSRKNRSRHSLAGYGTFAGE